MRSAKESSVEQYLCRRVAELRGLCIKLDAQYYRGIPDRLVILPRGGVCFVETKRPQRGVVSPAQKFWKERLEFYGHSVFIVSTREQVDLILPPS